MKKCTILFALLIFTAKIFAGTGGPDLFGYTWKDSNEPDGPAYNWIDITAFPNATQVKLLGDDNSRGPFPLNFNFHYYWYDVNQFWVGSNGYILFQDGQLASPFSAFANSALPNDVIGAFCNDLTFLNANNPGECWYYLNPALDTLIVSWMNVPFFDVIPAGFSGSNTFQIILSAVDSSITFQYEQVDPTAPVTFSASSVGIENYAAVPGAGLQWPSVGLIQTPPDSFAIKYYYPHPQLLTNFTDAAIIQNQNPSTGGIFVAANGFPNYLTTQVKNYSTHTVNPFNVACKVLNSNGDTIILENFMTDTLLTTESQDIAFTTQFVPTTPGTYRFITISQLPGDAPASGNNTKKLEIVALDTTQSEMWMGYDGGQTNGLAGINWVGGSGGVGNYFIPPFYPIAITKLHYWITSFANTDAFSGRVFDDDGVLGLPFTLLDSVHVSSANITVGNWTDINLSAPIIINSGGFYVAWDEIGESITLGCATAEPLSNRSFEEFQNIWGIFRFRSAQDPMIAVTIEKSYPTGLPNPDDKSLSLSVTPNPASDRITMLYNIADGGARNTLLITDLQGKIMQTIKLNFGAGTHQMNFDVSSLPAGIYFVTLMSGKEKSVQKLVITK
ncbi:MAG TPA: T9SS type A sorting domain-containing protein [Chitinophagales bacterium]|nr:T9SS type A sorting domain-containing protein [Chitinophagales bacterium]